MADLQALQPILTRLNASGKDLPEALELLTSYPFPRTVSLPNERGGIRGDYANLYITIDTSLENAINNLLGQSVPLPLPKAKTGAKGSGQPTQPTPQIVTPKDMNNDLVTILLGGLR